MEKLLLNFRHVFSLSSVKAENIIFRIFRIVIKVVGKIFQNSHSNGFFQFV